MRLKAASYPGCFPTHGTQVNIAIVGCQRIDSWCLADAQITKLTNVQNLAIIIADSPD